MRTVIHWNNLSSDGFPNIRHIRFSREGCWAVLSRLCFCQENLGQMKLKPSVWAGVL